RLSICARRFEQSEMWRLLMPDGALRRWTLVALGVLFVGLLAGPARIEAQIPGGIPGTVGGTTTVLGGTGTLAAGSRDSLYREADSISTSLVSADVPSARVIGYVDEIASRSEEHTSELQSRVDLVFSLLLEKQ